MIVAAALALGVGAGLLIHGDGDDVQTVATERGAVTSATGVDVTVAEPERTVERTVTVTVATTATVTVPTTATATTATEPGETSAP